MIDVANGWNNYLSYGYNITDWYHPNSDWFAMKHTGHKDTFIKNPSGKLIWGESNDWWFWWPGADYTIGWDVLGHDTISPYQNAGCAGPTMYRHNEGANINFYDGHVEYMKKEKVWIQQNWDNARPAMWSVFGRYPPTPSQMNAIPTPMMMAIPKNIPSSIGPTPGMLATNPPSERINPSTTISAMGISGAQKKLRNFWQLNLRA